MSIACHCPSCGAGFEVESRLAGHQVTCPECESPVVVAASAAPRKPAKSAPPRRQPAPSAPALPSIVVARDETSPVEHSAASHPRRAARDRTFLLGTLIAAGTLLVGLVAVVLVYLLASGMSSGPPSPGPLAGGAASDSPGRRGADASPVGVESILEIDWPEAARDDGAVFIDRGRRELPRTGPARYTVGPGAHHVVLMRRGYHPAELRRRFEPGETYRFEPRWEASDAPPWDPQAKPDEQLVFGPEFDDWIQDFEKARQVAAKERKDILLLFSGSDWCNVSKTLATEVLFQRDFRERVYTQFVLVLIDFPRGEPAKAKVEDAQRNEALARRFGVDGYPTVVLAEADGRVYGVQGYVRGGVNAFMERLSNWRSIDGHFQALVGQIEQAETAADRHEAMRQALDLLQLTELTRFHGPRFDEWLPLAEGGDDALFARLWVSMFKAAGDDDAGAAKVSERFIEWLASHELKDSEIAAALHLSAAMALHRAGRRDEAVAQCDQGLACKPRNPELRSALDALRRGRAPAPRTPGLAGTGTGFCVAEEGFILTNSHVVEDARRLLVQVPGHEEKLPARLVAADATGDVALVKVELPEDVDLPAIRVASAAAEAGEEVVAMGYPYIGQRDMSLLLTRGIVSALADPSRDGMIATDCKINPGNSGGPMFNARAAVLGMVTAKSFSNAFTDSFGLITPAPVLHEFLEKHLPDYDNLAPAAFEATRDLKPQELHRMFAPSVVLIENVQ